MFYFDCHVHAFNDKIAQRAIATLEKNPDGYKSLTDGTLKDTRKKLIEYGVNRAVMLPIATKPTQQTVINDWSAEIQDDLFISFGSVHPYAEDVMEELERVKALGLHGIKLHPDFIDVMVNDEKMLDIYRKCAELELSVILHCGIDPSYKDNVHAYPQATADAVEKVPQATFILAHLGGVFQWDDVEKYLVGKNVYFDTAFLAQPVKEKAIDNEQIERIIKNHGVEKILFGSDLPWDNPSDVINIINSLNLTEKEKHMIFHENLEKLLKV